MLEIEKNIFWGPYAALKSGRLWAGNINDNMLPVDLEEISIKDCLLKEKRKIEKELEKKLKKFLSDLLICVKEMYSFIRKINIINILKT